VDQCTLRRNYAPFTSSTHRAFHGERAGKSDGGGLAVGARYVVRDNTKTDCIKQGNKTSARLLPLESLARGCSGSKFFCAPGPAVKGRSSRAPSPARPSFDFDHALPLSRSLSLPPPPNPSSDKED
jgi:hypothetical protein